MGLNWQPDGCDGVTLEQGAANEFAFQFPKHGGHVNYILGQGAPRPHIGQTLVIHYRITKTSRLFNPVFYSLDQSGPMVPQFRPMLQHANDNMRTPNYRWWASVFGKLEVTKGIASLWIPVKPQYWTNVDGKQNTAGFADTLANLGNVALTFGGGNSFGHGVTLTKGKARFELLHFSIS